MIARAPAVAVFLTVALAAHAAAQEPRLARLDPATRAAVEALLDSAASRGLPREPLVDRALEGAIKRAPGPAIVAAVGRLAADLGTAHRLLGPRASPAELDAAAAALRAGADPQLITALRKTRGARPLTVPLAVLADLVASGVPPGEATRAVLTLAGASDERLVQFRRSVERDIALGAPPAAAAAIRVNADVRAGGPPARKP